MPRPAIKSQGLATVVGVGLLAAGWLCLHDAYGRRNRKPPVPLRPFLPFR